MLHDIEKHSKERKLLSSSSKSWIYRIPFSHNDYDKLIDYLFQYCIEPGAFYSEVL